MCNDINVRTKERIHSEERIVFEFLCRKGQEYKLFLVGTAFWRHWSDGSQRFPLVNSARRLLTWSYRDGCEVENLEWFLCSGWDWTAAEGTGFQVSLFAGEEAHVRPESQSAHNGSVPQIYPELPSPPPWTFSFPSSPGVHSADLGHQSWSCLYLKALFEITSPGFLTTENHRPSAPELAVLDIPFLKSKSLPSQ